MTAVPNVTLNNGVEIPQLGFGVLFIDRGDTVEAVRRALEVGYRHIDTAEGYRNEKEVGEAVRQSGLPRREVFITSKLGNIHHTEEEVRRALDGTLRRLGVEQIDLYLIHWPLPTVRNYVVAWKALEAAYADGQARAIGVSNFLPGHLRRLFDETDTVPAVNQIEAHPYYPQPELRAFDEEHGIATEAWSPLARGPVLADPVIVGIADRLGRTPAQVVLRWHIQLGNIVIPKTVTRSRMEENFQLFDFQLGVDDMAAISGLDCDGRIGPDPATFDMVPK